MRVARKLWPLIAYLTLITSVASIIVSSRWLYWFYTDGDLGGIMCSLSSGRLVWHDWSKDPSINELLSSPHLDVVKKEVALQREFSVTPKDANWDWSYSDVRTALGVKTLIVPLWPIVAFSILSFCVVVPRIRKILRTSSKEHCARCGYSLSGCSSMTCPECGEVSVKADASTPSLPSGLDAKPHASVEPQE